VKEAPGKTNRPADASNDQRQENQAPDPNHNGLDGVAEDDVKDFHVSLRTRRSGADCNFSRSKHTGWNNRQ
jgi:hypothetical protein